MVIDVFGSLDVMLITWIEISVILDFVKSMTDSIILLWMNEYMGFANRQSTCIFLRTKSMNSYRQSAKA